MRHRTSWFLALAVFALLGGSALRAAATGQKEDRGEMLAPGRPMAEAQSELHPELGPGTEPTPTRAVRSYLPLIARKYPSPTASATATATPSPTMTFTPTASATSSPSATPSPTGTATPTGTPTAEPGTWATILSEGFEDAPDRLWRFFDADGTSHGEYFWARRTCRPATGGYSAWAVGGGSDGATLPCGADYPDNARAWMVYGPFSLADAAAAELRFRLWLNRGTEADQLCWGASSDGAIFPGFCLSGSPSGWINLSLDLAEVAGFSMLGQAEVWVAFVFTSDADTHYPEGAYIDDITIRKCSAPPCDPGARGDP